jgi:hypothetical protein
LLFGFSAFDLKELFPQKVSKKGMELVSIPFQRPDQRELAFFKIGDESPCLFRLEKLVCSLRIYGGQQRGAARKLLLLRAPGAIELLGQGVERITSLGVLLLYVCESFAQASAKLEEPSRISLNQFIPGLSTKLPHRGVFNGDDGRRARFPGQKRHFTEPFLRAQDRDAFPSASTTLEDHLDGARLDKIEGIALIALGEDRRSSTKKSFL